MTLASSTIDYDPMSAVPPCSSRPACTISPPIRKSCNEDSVGSNPEETAASCAADKSRKWMFDRFICSSFGFLGKAIAILATHGVLPQQCLMQDLRLLSG